jgi:predicted GIY-YIG superfamily endonuclease
MTGRPTGMTTRTTTRRRDIQGQVYLLHFEVPYRHAQHYLGWTEDLPTRLKDHRRGRGARLMEVITAAGIRFTLARTWPGTRTLERRLKNRGGHARLCPICQASELGTADNRCRGRERAGDRQPARRTAD